jgi:integrase
MIYLYLDEIKGVLSESTVEQYTERLRRFDYWMTANARRDYNRETVVEFIKHMQRKEVGKASIALHKAAVSAFYSWLVENGKIKSNPVKNLRMGRYRSQKKQDDCPITKEEYEKIKAACRQSKIRFDFWEGATIIGWNTGLRLGDIACMEWQSISLAYGKIELEPNKTKRLQKRVEIPIAPELNRWLQMNYPLRIDDKLFPAMYAEYAENGAKHLSQQFTRICEKAGVEGKTFHLLRHSLVTRLLSNGVPASIVSGITGQTLPVIDRYNHPSFSDKAKAMMHLV